MAKAETDEKCFAQCATCTRTFTAKVKVDGTLRPIGIDECPCGDSDIKRVDI